MAKQAPTTQGEAVQALAEREQETTEAAHLMAAAALANLWAVVTEDVFKEQEAPGAPDGPPLVILRYRAGHRIPLAQAQAEDLPHRPATPEDLAPPLG